MCRLTYGLLYSVDYLSESCTLIEQTQDYLTEELPLEKKKKSMTIPLKNYKFKITIENYCII